MTYLGQTGMVCSVGLGVAAASAAMRAGMAKFDELPYADRRGRPIVGASVPGLGFRLRRGERLVEMMALAIADCLGEKPAFPLREVPLLVGLPNPDGLPGGGLHWPGASSCRCRRGWACNSIPRSRGGFRRDIRQDLKPCVWHGNF